WDLAVLMGVPARSDGQRDLQHVAVGHQHHRRLPRELVGVLEDPADPCGDRGDLLDPVLVGAAVAVHPPDLLVGARGALVIPAEAAFPQPFVHARRRGVEPGGELLRGLQSAREIARDDHGARPEPLGEALPGRLSGLVAAVRGQPHLRQRPWAGDRHDEALDVRGGLAVAEHPDPVRRGAHGLVILPGLRFRPGSLSASSPWTMRTPTSPMSSVIHGWCSVPTAWWWETVEPRSTNACCTAFFAA